MSRYRKIEVRTWGDERFRSLSAIPPCGQGLWFFLLTGPHTTAIPGLFRAGRAAMAEELGWSVEDLDEAFTEVLAEGMAKVDFDARLVWLPNAIKHNRPESPNVVKSWGAEFEMMPECDIKREAYALLKDFITQMGEGFARAFDEAFEKPPDKPLAKALPKTMANQEQEQEQEQEQKENIRAARAARRELGEKTFPRFWEAYPKREGANPRHPAETKFVKLVEGGEDPDVIIDGTVNYAKSFDVLPSKFVKQAVGFLNARMYRDDHRPRAGPDRKIWAVTA